VSPFTFRRKAARVVLLDGERRVLLLRASDPADPGKGSWWELPGGGIESDENSEDAARRELLEETGIAEVEIGPCVWIQHAEFDFGGYHFDQDERIHVAWCDGAQRLLPTRLEALEVMAFEGGRWWTLDELLACDDVLLPRALRELLPPLVAGELPVEPLDIGVRPDLLEA
jgi:8-oxo-dGTP pyrophosphatase MutT (NUDIX family)